MTRKRFSSPKPYIQLIAFLLLLLSLSKPATESFQGYSIAILAPTWEQLATIKRGLHHLTDRTVAGEDERQVYVSEEIQKLSLENQLLKNEVAKLQEALKQETFILNEWKDEPLHRIRTHEKELIMNLELESVPALVIFRSSAAWNNYLWVNVGNKHNDQLKKTIIAKNSPVVVGTSVVGVIDYVGKKQSRVRLLTDPSLTPSVRAIRTEEDQTWYLAKGELRGSTAPKMRTKRNALKGTGFNYDFPDHEGPARDLRTGAVIQEREGNTPPLPIIQPHDLLITTGMDGVFPPGLEVAAVTHVQMLKEGDYHYDIEAVPCCESFDRLTMVSILPPLGFDPFDQPTRY
jgi:rod shape-determining protein MreC